MDKYIGIGGIIATLVVGVLTCIVTWIVAKKSQTKKRLNYTIKVTPILSSNIIRNTDSLSISYQNKLLSEPCLLTINISNVGNSAISKPPIKIISKDVNFIIPAYIEDVPDGYEDLWLLNKDNNNECSIYLDHINKKQVVKARFFLDKMPNEIPKFICPMIDLEIKQIDYDKIYFTVLDMLIDLLSPPFFYREDKNN